MLIPAVLFATSVARAVIAAPALRAQDPHTRVSPEVRREREAMQRLIDIVSTNVLSAAAAMPADKYGFAPSEGAFEKVRSFRKEVRHLAATNYILAAAALGQDPPADAGDESGPDSLTEKDDLLRYARGSFAMLGKAAQALGEPGIAVRSSPISPLQGSKATREALIAEALLHSYDHYGQMVVYLRMNGVIPPASRR